MKPAAFSLLLCVLALQACKSTELKYGFIRKRKVDSYRQILDLKKGNLLVMLHSKQNKIDALNSVGRNAEAVNIEDQQMRKNKLIIKSFRKYFDFCPAYFFMSTQGNDLVEKGMDAITFLDDSLHPDPSIHVHSANFLVAEFGNLQSDTAKYFGGYRLSTQDTGAWRKPYYYSTSTYGYQAFIIESPLLIQLKKPFPNFVIITETDDRIFYCESVIKKINRKLKSFFEESNEKIFVKRFSPYFTDMIAPAH